MADGPPPAVLPPPCGTKPKQRNCARTAEPAGCTWAWPHCPRRCNCRQSCGVISCSYLCDYSTCKVIVVYWGIVDCCSRWRMILRWVQRDCYWFTLFMISAGRSFNFFLSRALLGLFTNGCLEDAKISLLRRGSGFFPID